MEGKDAPVLYSTRMESSGKGHRRFHLILCTEGIMSDLNDGVER
jgi:hypothetical protein